MFLLLYFETDKQLDCVNSRKVKNATNSALEINQIVKVPYKTRVIDDAGREKNIDVDYDGRVVYMSKEKTVINQMKEREKEVIDSIIDGTLNELLEEFHENPSKRKSKKTTKLISYIEDEGTGKTTVETPKKKRKAPPIPAKDAHDSPSKNTRSKTSKEETQRLQTMEYFRRKATIQENESSAAKRSTPSPLLPQPQCATPMTSPPSNVATTQHRLPQAHSTPKKSPKEQSYVPTKQGPLKELLMPSTQQHMPTIQEQMPTTQEHVSLKQHMSATQEDRLSQEHMPSTQEHMPTTQEHRLSQYAQEHMSTTQEHVSLQQHMPTTQHRLSQQHMPTTQEHIPPTQEHRPSQQHMPTTQEHMPLQQHKPPEQVPTCTPQFLQPVPTVPSTTITIHPLKKRLLPPVVSQPERFYSDFESEFCDDWNTFTSITSTSSAISQGYNTLLESSNCASCELYKSKLEEKEEEIYRLNLEIDYLRSLNSGQGRNQSTAFENLISEMKSLIGKYEVQRAPNKDYQLQAEQGPEMNDSIEPDFETSIEPESNTSLQKDKKSSTSGLGDFGPDDISSVQNFQEFFRPGENKVKLVDAYNLFIDSTKLQAMRLKAKKNPSRIARDLLLYYFSLNYLSEHSATGLRSSKKGLPVQILQPIQEFLQRQFKCENAVALINRKCLDIGRSLKSTSSKI